MKKIVALMFLAAIISAAPSFAQQVKLDVEKETIPTHQIGAPEVNPIFFTGRVYQGAEGYIYPYPLYDVITDKVVDKTYEIVKLKNDYISIGVLPEIGGRIFQAEDLTDNYHFFYTQTGIKPALIGMLGAWLSGGVEWDIPDHHRASSYMLVDWTTEDNPDGSKTVWVGESELRHRLKWSVGITIFPNSSRVQASVKVINPTPMIQSMFERLLQGTGKTNYIFYMQISGTVFNAIVDPILIFGFFGLPAMGARGAALATVFGQILGCILGLTFNRKFNKEVELSIRKIRPDWQTMKDIYRIGIPSIVLQSVGAVMNFSINKILAQFSDLAVTTFGVYFKLQSFVFMPLFGMNNASVPIIAYNYGADRKDRLEEAMRLGVRYGIGVMACGTLLFWLIPEKLMALFNAPPEMVAMGVVALHIMSLNFPFAGFAIMRGATFQALGKSVYSMNISLVRQLAIIIPCAYIFAKIGGVNMVWWAFPVAEVAGTTMSILYTRRIRRTILSKMTPR